MTGWRSVDAAIEWLGWLGGVIYLIGAIEGLIRSMIYARRHKRFLASIENTPAAGPPYYPSFCATCGLDRSAHNEGVREVVALKGLTPCAEFQEPAASPRV